MKVLLDNCVPRPLRQHLPGHEVITAYAMGWAALENGALLSAAETQFAVMITADQNLRHQQNSKDQRRLALIILPTNQLHEVIALAPKVLASLGEIQPGDWCEIEP